MNFKQMCQSVKQMGLTAKEKAAGVALAGLVLANSAHAQSSTGINSLFDSVDLSGISAKVLALSVLIVGIALVMKGSSIVKRIIAKI